MAKHNWMRKLTSPAVVLNILALALFIVVLWFGSQQWMAWYTHHGEGIEVPDLVGQKVLDAQEELYDLKLEGVVVDSVYDKHKPAGTVLDQKPEQGARVKSGRQIYLTINKKAMDKQQLPNIIGNSTLQQARELLVKNGFIVGNTEYSYGEKNMVLGVKANGQRLTNGQFVQPDIPLTLVVGNEITEHNEYDEDYNDMDVWGDNYDDPEEDESFWEEIL